MSKIYKCRNGHPQTDENRTVILVKGRMYWKCLDCYEAKQIRNGRKKPNAVPRDTTRCVNGHEYVDGSYRIHFEGKNNAIVRRCKECQRQRSAEYRDRLKKRQAESLKAIKSRYPVFS